MTIQIKEPTSLEDRMKKHTAGQVTWPEPKLGRWCSECRHYFTKDTAHADKGRCDLVRMHQKVSGKQFNGANAIACPQFDAGKHEGND